MRLSPIQILMPYSLDRRYTNGLSDAPRPTLVFQAQRLIHHLGTRVVLASETFQHTGSFKFRAAMHVAKSVTQRRLLAASSGNFGQALAAACALLDKSSLIVMPMSAAKVKVDAIRSYGGEVDFVDTRVTSRKERVAALRLLHPDAYVASAYDDPLVIAGNSSLGVELAERLPEECDTVVLPIGGGGLASGVIEGFRRAGRRMEIIAAEPAMANDAARSLRAGEIVANATEPQTLADGARTLSVGEHNWPILQAGLHDVIEVPEPDIAEAVRLLFSTAHLKAEPTGALSVAALLTAPDRFRDRTVCCVVSGGNVDTDLYLRLLDF
jgi:threonine dehydratase